MKFRVSGFKFRLREFKIQNSKLKTQVGFTLLEVVVAMAIVGLGVVALFEIFSLGLRLESRSAARTEAVAFGRQVMDEALIRRSLNAGEESGSLGGDLRWRLRVQPLKDEGQLAPTGVDVNEIAVAMRYRDGDRERQIEMRTLRVLKQQNR
jgi:general secretion pathway protein I